MEGKLTDEKLERKVFQDPIHGPISFHPLAVKIIDTPEFQRLRFVKQLGLAFLVYPGATHSRFEHSLGVSYLAGEFLRKLRNEQKSLNITETDILRVEIAGLCHDLGHGPFSHLWDHVFDLEHELISVKMLQHIHETYDHIKKGFEKNGVTLQDINSLIKPPKILPKEKAYLYQIVANSKNGIDVDKFDYLARDMLYIGGKLCFDYRRLMYSSRVRKDEKGYWNICYRDKEALNIRGMFHTRTILLELVHKHRVVQIFDAMITDVIEDTRKVLQFEGKKSRFLSLENCHEDIKAFSQLTDDIVWHGIKQSKDSRMKKAKGILEKVAKRELYTYVGSVNCNELYKEITKNRGKKDKQIEKDIQDQICSYLKLGESERSRHEKDVIVKLLKINAGREEEDPLDSVDFYEKNPHPDVITTLSEAKTHKMLIWQDVYVQVICRNKDCKDHILSAFESWRGENKLDSGEFSTRQVGSISSPTQDKRSNEAFEAEPARKKLRYEN